MIRTAQVVRLLQAAAWALVVLYLAQHVTAPPNSTEGGVVFDYVHRFAVGQDVYFDFRDAYGPFTWYLPSGFYLLAGETVLGIRVYLLLVKIATVVVGYGLVRSLSDGFFATLAALVLTLLVGLPWACMQIPYAAHLAVVLAMGTWWLVLAARPDPSPTRLLVAALLTAATIWTKVSSGAFLLSGVAFYLFYWHTAREPSGDDGARAPALRVVQLAGLAAYAVVFHLFIRRDANVLFFLYLSLPLVVVLAFTARHVLCEQNDRARTRARIRSASVYVLLTALCAVAYLLAYFGRSSGAYLRDQLALLGTLRYSVPFPPIGVPGPHRGFNEYFWPQLPLLTHGALLLALALRLRRRALPHASASASEGAFLGLAIMVVLQGFVIYSRAGEPQLIQAIVPSAAAFFVFVFHAERQFPPSTARLRPHRLLLAVTVVCAATTIVSLPEPGAYSLGRGGWASPRLAHLRAHPRDVPYFTRQMQNDVLDQWVDSAATQVADLAAEGETVLLLGATDLVTYASGTTPAGGRHAPLLYLLRAGILDREGFLSLVPAEELRRLVEDPPRVVVAEVGPSALLAALPELAEGIHRNGYALAGRHGFLLIFERRQGARQR